MLKIIGYIIVALVIFGAGYWYSNENKSVSEFVTETVDQMQSESTAEGEADTNTTAADTDVSSSPITIPATALSDGQKKLLQTLGVDADSFVITPAIAACAEGAVGKTRITEIMGGTTPSFLEGVKLVACYKGS